MMKGLRQVALAAAAVALGALGHGEACAGALTGAWTDHAGACALVLEQYDGATLHLRVRAADPGSLARCVPTFAELAAGVGRLLAAAGTPVAGGPSGPAGTATLFVGTVGDVPGLSEELVAASRASAGWDAASGRPRSGDPNGFVAGLLRASPLLRDLFASHTIAGVSVEKMLVPTRRAVRERRPGDGVPDARLPYDAQLWVRLAAKPR
jgi:hypothetical protein